MPGGGDTMLGLGVIGYGKERKGKESLMITIQYKHHIEGLPPTATESPTGPREGKESLMMNTT